MKKAYNKDIWRAMMKGKKRFFSIMLITALGVTMLSGLRAACQDLRYTADIFYDDSNLFDISVVSTLGLTTDDVEALADYPGVRQAEGTYSEVVKTRAGEQNKRAEMKILTQEGINIPYLLEGELPKEKNEMAVTSNYLVDTGKTIGDSVVIEEQIEEDEDPNFLETGYLITGTVIDPEDVNSKEGAVAFRTASNADYVFFVNPMAVESEVYSEIYMTLAEGSSLLCYSTAYEKLVKDTVHEMNVSLKPGRQQARYDEIVSKAEAELADAQSELEQELADAQEKLDKAREELQDGRRQLEEAHEELLASRQTMEQYGMLTPQALQQLEEGEAQWQEKQEELEEAETELIQEEEKFEGEKADAWAEIEEARAEIGEIEKAQWYIQDRSSLSGYTNVKTDADCIESVGTAFPIIFFLVAILISLTTITRMVEEERGLIGTYKALGFTDREIRKKYLVYAATACLLGGMIGDICGFLVLPKIIFIIFRVMYQLPQYHYQFDMLYGMGGILLFAVGIIAATWIACEAELSHTPATLMRPKAPKRGARVFIERITPIWRRMSFLNKVTARNLFRYKKRMLMTIGGIMGCTALVLCGFVIKDSVTELMPGQYERIYQYDMLAVASDGENETLLSYVEEAQEIADYTNLRIESAKIKNEEDEELTVQLFVVESDSSLEGYINLMDQDNKAVTLSKQGMLVTQNAANILGLTKNRETAIQNLKLEQHKLQIDTLVKNYMGNVVYITRPVYEEVFGKYEPNAVLVHFMEDMTDQRAFTEEFGGREGVLQTSSVEELKDQFSMAFSLINMVVYIIIVMAAGLALVVLFTLVTTNISERVRELATIKVLGFYDKEVHLYVNKETLILTGIGILLGLPLGNVLGGMLTNALNMPAIYFEVVVHPISYVIAAVISFAFAVMVDVLTDRTLDHIDPVEALKSVE